MNLSAMRLIFLLLFGVTFESVLGKVAYDAEVFGRKSHGLKVESQPKEGDEKMIRLIEEEMLSLNKSDDPRDKRALGVILQGFMEALGYTVSPIQFASLPNSGPMPAAAASAMMPPAMMNPMSPGMMNTMPPGMMNPMPPGMMNMMPPMPPNASASTPRQRETVRITGVLNFGDNSNTSNLQNHLSQFERLFHGNRSAPAPAPAPAGPPPPPPPPAPAPAPAAPPHEIDPRSRPPLPEPLFVKIPIPIVPNLPPPQPSPTPTQDDYHDEYYSKEHSDEYSSSKDDEGKRGDDDEEDEKSHYSEEYESKQEQYDEPEDRNYESEGSHEGSNEPVEKNSEREYKNSKNVENYQVENKELRHPSEVSEEVPIANSKFNHAMFVDEPDWKKKTDDYVSKIAAEQEARVETLAEENAEREKNRSHEEEEDAEFHRSREKEISDNNKEHDSRYESDEKDDNYSADDEEEEENSKSSEMPRSNSQRNEAHAELPISYDRETSRQDETLRDSYGEILEKPDGSADERVAGYFSMFKNPDTGVYDPARVQEYENARINFDHSDLIDGFNRIQKEYGSPQNKYEEYEIENEDRVEHRAKVDVQKLPENSEKEPSTRKGCNCESKKSDVQTQEAKNPERSVTAATPQPSYGPYYPQINYLYDPATYDQGIIARLTSYNQPKTVKLDHNRAKVQTIQPTPYPEYLTTMSWLQESEAKEIRAWPSPFDYAYDNSEQSKVVLKKSPMKPAPFKPTRKICKDDVIKGQQLLTRYQDERSSAMSNQESRRLPNDSKNGRKIKQNEYRTSTLGYLTTLEPTEATIFEQRKRPPTTEKSMKRNRHNRPPKHHSAASEVRSQYSELVPTTKRPPRDRKNHRRTNQVRESKTQYQAPGSKTIINKKPNSYLLPPRRTNLKEEGLNYVERNGMLIIPEPTPYYYNERIDHFTEEPESDMEKVKIKEFRNRIASVKVSELKQLHPEGSTQIFQYTRHL